MIKKIKYLILLNICLIKPGPLEDAKEEYQQAENMVASKQYEAAISHYQIAGKIYKNLNELELANSALKAEALARTKIGESLIRKNKLELAVLEFQSAKYLFKTLDMIDAFKGAQYNEANALYEMASADMKEDRHLDEGVEPIAFALAAGRLFYEIGALEEAISAYGLAEFASMNIVVARPKSSSDQALFEKKVGILQEQIIGLRLEMVNKMFVTKISNKI